MKAKQILVGDTIVIPKYGRTRNGIKITNIKGGRLRSQVRLCYSNTSIDVDREEEVTIHCFSNDPVPKIS